MTVAVRIQIDEPNTVTERHIWATQPPLQGHYHVATIATVDTNGTVVTTSWPLARAATGWSVPGDALALSTTRAMTPQHDELMHGLGCAVLAP